MKRYRGSGTPDAAITGRSSSHKKSKLQTRSNGKGPTDCEKRGNLPAQAVSGGVESRKVGDLSPDQLWSEFISQRQPVRIMGHLPDKQWKVSKWSNSYLMSKAVRIRHTAVTLIDCACVERDGTLL